MAAEIKIFMGIATTENAERADKCDAALREHIESSSDEWYRPRSRIARVDKGTGCASSTYYMMVSSPNSNDAKQLAAWVSGWMSAQFDK